MYHLTPILKVVNNKVIEIWLFLMEINWVVYWELGKASNWLVGGLGNAFISGFW